LLDICAEAESHLIGNPVGADFQQTLTKAASQIPKRDGLVCAFSVLITPSANLDSDEFETGAGYGTNHRGVSLRRGQVHGGIEAALRTDDL